MSKERKQYISGRERFERDVMIIRLAEGGKTAAEIAEDVGCRVSTVYGACKRLDVQLKAGKVGPKFKFSTEEAEKLFRSGETLGEIAVHFGASRQAVQHRLAKIGITRFDGGYAKRVHDEYRARQEAAE